MKKLLSLALALIMVLTLSVAVFADTTHQDDPSVSIGVSFAATNGNAGTPQETFNYTISKGAAIGAEGAMVYVEESSLADVAESVPLPKVTAYSVPLTPGREGSFTISLPIYTSVGIYYYTVTQTEGNTAGVKYDTRKMIVKVTVIQQGENKVRVAFATASLADTNPVNGVTDVKTATFVNTYSAGSLSVEKLVAGTLGDRDKDFEVRVTFNAVGGKNIESTISYSATAGGQPVYITPEQLDDGTESVTITLSHEDTITFDNIPYGVTYSVAETEYPEYVDTYQIDGVGAPGNKVENVEFKSATPKVTITNTRDAAVDTGIVLDSLPYVLLIAVAVVGVVIFTARKRSHREY